MKIEDLRPFPGNPFHLVEDEQLMELSESIREFGMAAPSSSQQRRMVETLCATATGKMK